MMLKHMFTTCVTVTITATAFASPKPAYVWNELSPGFRYTSFSFSAGANERATLHAFIVDPKKYRFDVLTPSPEHTSTGSTAKIMAEKKGAVLAINGGYFSQDHTSVGLLVRDGKIINPLHRTSWWSIFSLTKGTPNISKQKEFNKNALPDVALQAGPRLVIDGQIPKFKNGRAPRTAIGITDNGEVLIVVTQGAGLTLEELAKRFVLSRWDGGLECNDAMNLDGGSSTQLFAKIGKLTLDIPGLAPIPNALAVFPQQ